MATVFLKTQKDCCICQHWKGQRELDVNKNVRVSSGNIKGLCLRNKKETPANYSSCPFFVKWDKLS